MKYIFSCLVLVITLSTHLSGLALAGESFSRLEEQPPVMAQHGMASRGQQQRPAQHYRYDYRLGSEYLFAASDKWSHGFGIHGRCVLWGDEDVGLALSGGGQKWLTDGRTFVMDGLERRFRGATTMIPVGLSLMLRETVGDGGRLSLEAGLRYVHVDNTFTLVTSRDGEELRRERISAGNGLVSLLALEIELPVGQGAAIYAGAGYQFDLMRGGYRIEGMDRKFKNDLAGWLVSGGIKIEY